LTGNSGNFLDSTPLIWSNGPPFASFLHFSDWLYARIRRTDSIALTRLAELLFDFLTQELALDPRTTAEALWCDYQRGGRHDVPEFLREHLPDGRMAVRANRSEVVSLKRQARRLA
jgi:hypothetical protein